MSKATEQNDKLKRAIIISAVLHVILFAALIWSSFDENIEASAGGGGGSSIDAVMVDSGAVVEQYKRMQSQESSAKRSDEQRKMKEQQAAEELREKQAAEQERLKQLEKERLAAQEQKKQAEEAAKQAELKQKQAEEAAAKAAADAKAKAEADAKAAEEAAKKAAADAKKKAEAEAAKAAVEAQKKAEAAAAALKKKAEAAEAAAAEARKKAATEAAEKAKAEAEKKAAAEKAAADKKAAAEKAAADKKAAEKAAAENDLLHLFIVSEDASLVPFKIRKQLVMKGTAHLKNICYHDSGPYIISNATFPSYFQKDENAVIESHAMLDLTVFTQIAKVLGITRRYVGEEPTSLVTGIYNRIMSEKLPEQGIECIVVPRKTCEDTPISASNVRLALQNGDYDTLSKLVPQTTLDYFKSPEAIPVIERIRQQENVIHY